MRFHWAGDGVWLFGPFPLPKLRVASSNLVSRSKISQSVSLKSYCILLVTKLRAKAGFRVLSRGWEFRGIGAVR